MSKEFTLEQLAVLDDEVLSLVLADVANVAHEPLPICIRIDQTLEDYAQFIVENGLQDRVAGTMQDWLESEGIDIWA
jgi:hypothetical protein